MSGAIAWILVSLVALCVVPPVGVAMILALVYVGVLAR